MPLLKTKKRPEDLQIVSKRLSLTLADSVYDELFSMAKERRSSMTEVVRLALGLVKVAIHEAKQGHKLIVTNAKGEALKELVLPD